MPLEKLTIRSYSQAFAPSLGALRDSLMNNLRITYTDAYIDI
jgi:hypothetical protein